MKGPTPVPAPRAGRLRGVLAALCVLLLALCALAPEQRRTAAAGRRALDGDAPPPEPGAATASAPPRVGRPAARRRLPGAADADEDGAPGAALALPTCPDARALRAPPVEPSEFETDALAPLELGPACAAAAAAAARARPAAPFRERVAFGFTLTQLSEAYVDKVVAAAAALRALTDADLLVLVVDDDAAASPAARARLEAALAPLGGARRGAYAAGAGGAARVVRARVPLAEADAPEALRRANRLNDNCCGWNEYLKLAWWGLEDEYARVAVLDLDVRLLRSPDALLRPPPRAALATCLAAGGGGAGGGGDAGGAGGDGAHEASAVSRAASISSQPGALVCTQTAATRNGGDRARVSSSSTKTPGHAVASSPSQPRRIAPSSSSHTTRVMNGAAFTSHTSSFCAYTGASKNSRRTHSASVPFSAGAHAPGSSPHTFARDGAPRSESHVHEEDDGA